MDFTSMAWCWYQTWELTALSTKIDVLMAESWIIETRINLLPTLIRPFFENANFFLVQPSIRSNSMPFVLVAKT